MKCRKEIEETEKNRQKLLQRLDDMEDQRNHLLLYFFEGHHVKPIDFTIIKHLQNYVNVIPVIAKADSFTP